MPSTFFTRRYQILTIVCSLISCLLIISFDSSTWRIIETNNQQLLTPFYPPLQYDLIRYCHNHENKTFVLNIGPLWRCLTTKLNNAQRIYIRECTITNNSFDYTIISIGIGTFLVFIILSISIISHCLASRITIIRICMSILI